MTTKTTRISQLKGILVLQKKRSQLLDRLAVLERQIGEKLEQEVSRVASAPAIGGAKTTAARGATPKPRQVVIKTKSAARTETRGRRGALKEQIIAELEKAGENGISVRDLADRIGTKPANLHTWFSTNSKRVRGLKKVAAGRFALGGGAAKAAKSAKPVKTASTKAAKAAAPKAAKSAKPAKATKAPTAKTPKAAKAAKVTKAPAKPAAKQKKAAGEFVPAKRGELKENVLAELKKSGNEGITIKDLAEKVGTRYKNLYIWFVTTGKRIPGIEKVGPAKYRLVS